MALWARRARGALRTARGGVLGLLAGGAFVDVDLVEPEVGVGGGVEEEVFVGAGFDDAAAFEDDDFVGFADGGEAVGDDEDGAVLHEVFEGGLDLALGDGVDGGGGFVEDDHGWVFEEDAGDGEALFFALGEADAFFADVGFEAVGEVLDEVEGGGAGEGGEELGFGGVVFGEAEVVFDGAFEEEGVLGDKADV